jgi:hypothetical protein
VITLSTISASLLDNLGDDHSPYDFDWWAGKQPNQAGDDKDAHQDE